MIFSIRNLGFELGSLLLEGWAAFAARGKERTVKTHFDKKCANFSKRGLDSAAVPRYTLGQKVRFRAGCNSPLAVKSATTPMGC